MRFTYRAVLFDLDGTLVDSLADLANATNAALTAVGCAPHPQERYRIMVGDGARQLCTRALPLDRQDLVEETLKRMRAYYDTHCFDETKLYPGILDLVRTLAARGCKLAVLSNKPDDFTQRMITHYFQPNPFQIFYGSRSGVPLKPDPTSALEIARQLEIPVSEWLYLGDTNTDMQTAHAAGMVPVGVLWGFRDREELLASGAVEVIATPTDLLKL